MRYISASMSGERGRRIDELFHAAHPLEPRERAAFLAHACAGDDALRIEVESLLAQSPSIPGPLDRPATALTADRLGERAPDLTGHVIGTYHVQMRIGAGGMGEVYRAFDTKLNRPVAIKVLSSDVADAGRRRRFQREAQLASSLNHPHIVTVHDVGEIDGRQYLVTELVDGGTLRAWAVGQPRPWLQVVELLVGVADALAAAHSAGVLHRDVKPDNILVARNGYAKLADFGLAKLFEASESADRTATGTATMPGMVVGTIAYMSPEQATGRSVDARSDIFSFGVVLYELLAGQRPFGGNTDLERLQAIVHQPARPLADRCPQLPASLCMAVDKALEKQPGDRYQTMHDLVVDLKRAVRQTAAVSAVRETRRGPILYATVVTLLLVVLGAAAAVYWQRGRASTGAPRFALQPVTAFTDFATQPALSPDGRMLAFIRGAGSNLATVGQIYVKLLPDGDPVQLTHDESRKMAPAFSPDGTRVAYTVVSSDNFFWDTWIVPVLGGEPKPWLPNASGLQWTERQRVLFSEIKTGIHMALVTAAENRTESRDVYVPESERGMAHRSYLSPDRREVLVSEMDSSGMIPCRVVPFDGSSPGRVVGPSTGKCTHAAWTPDGRWMYFTSDASGSFQIWRQSVSGGAPEQLTFGPTEADGLAISLDGQSLYTSVGLRQVSVNVSEDGRDRQVSGEGSAALPAWGDGFPNSVFSPDGKQIYYLVRIDKPGSGGFGGGELWRADLTTGARDRVLPDLFITSFDISADGQRIVYAAADVNRKSRIWVARLDRRTPPALLPPTEALGPVFGANDDVFYRGAEGKLWYLFVVNVTSGQIRKFTTEPAVNSPIISPDRRLILSLVPTAGKDTSTVLKAFPVEGGSPATVCQSCSVKWTRDARHVFLSMGLINEVSDGRTYIVELPAGKMLPDLPANGFENESQLRTLPKVRVVDRVGLFPGATAATYAFNRAQIHRNIYRMTLPER